MAGALDPAARTAAIAHLDGCVDCRDLISLLARDATRAAANDTLRSVSPSGVAALTESAVATAPRHDATIPRAEPAPRSVPPAAERSGLRRARSSADGRSLGRYTLIDRLGAGAMGVVYRAEDGDLGRLVALKLLHRPDDLLTDRLIREARAMAQVNHPNVVAVYDVGIADGTTYIAMELVEGMSLRLWQQQRRSAAEIVAAYIAAGRGLAAAHAAGIVHRDFKPDNCLVGSDGRTRVTDFGLAAARASGAPPPSQIDLTSTGSVLGTPAYMAPEQFTGGNVDPRTDQFNFCVALHEALYGARPFSGRSFRMARAAVVLPQPDSPARPRLLPCSSRKLTPSTALTSPSRSLK